MAIRLGLYPILKGPCSDVHPLLESLEMRVHPLVDHLQEKVKLSVLLRVVVVTVQLSRIRSRLGTKASTVSSRSKGIDLLLRIVADLREFVNELAL